MRTVDKGIPSKQHLLNDLPSALRFTHEKENNMTLTFVVNLSCDLRLSLPQRW